ncbi:MAG: tRNA 2-thiocytidine biosynthesis protein TtcA, partial [Clostridia bacterium]|nr:tRNA 2-thiocytidine biosynthesis protein TtcA [Clostridia bacterium]
FLNCACKFTDGIAKGNVSSKREEIKNLLANLKQINPSVDMNIFSSIHKVNLSTVLGYIKDGKQKTFLDDY